MKNRTHPVNLMLSGRKALVVGGGNVAARKIAGLLKSGADVTLVTPKINSTLAEMIEANKIIFHKRDFDKADLNGAYIVYAATNVKNVNKRIIELCVSANILCSAVDENWTDGRFITPASFDKNGVTISVSTHGAACRRTRLIKETLARHVDMVDKAELFIIGTDHNCLGIDEREPCHLTGEHYAKVGGMLTHVWGVHEFMLLNTCNRVELAAIISPGEGLEGMLKHIMGFASLPEESHYVKYGKEAFGHLASVSAGLMSQMPGEKHITAQLKEALKMAKEKKWANSMMQEWIDSALHVSKHIRQELEPHLRDFEIEDLALDYIKSERGNLKCAKAIVLGTGVIGQNIVDRLVSSCSEVVWLYHQNKPKKSNVNICGLNQLKHKLSDVDLVVCATSASSPLIHHEHAPFMNQSKPVLIIDMAMPRNVSPELEKLMTNVKIVDLDGLKRWRRREALDMARIFELSNKIINGHGNFYEKIIHSFQGGNKSQQACADADK